MKQLFQKITFFVAIGISVSSFCAMTRWDLMKQRLGFKKIPAAQPIAAPVVNPYNEPQKLDTKELKNV